MVIRLSRSRMLGRVRYLEIGGARISRIGLGTWQFGSKEWGYGEDYTRQAVGILRRALDLGINLVDTAEVYAFGRSERIVGSALAGRRQEAFIATKIFPVLPVAPVVRWRAAASARRLGVNRIDLYQVHWPNPLVPISSTMAGMRAVMARGLVTHAGVSNFSLALWMRAEERLGAPVLSNQVRYSLLTRNPEADLIPYASRQGRLVIAYSPLGQGLLGGRYDGTVQPRGRMRRLNPDFAAGGAGRLSGLRDALNEIAARHGATPAQVALAWVLRHPCVVAIPGASTVDQVEQNAAAADLELGTEEIGLLSAFAPAG